MDRVNPHARRDEYGSRINRAHSPVLVHSIPTLSVMICSVLPLLIMTSSVPLVPPLAFMMLLAWRIIRPGMWPLWIGFPLGAFDDLFSGQPFGSAIVLWSLAMITIEVIDVRFPWRTYIQDWMMVVIALALYLIVSAVLSGGQLTAHMLVGLGPQFLLAALLFPLMARFAARLDRLRLTRVRVVG